MRIPRGAKATLVKMTVDVLSGEFTLTDQKHSSPGASLGTVRRLPRAPPKGREGCVSRSQSWGGLAEKRVIFLRGGNMEYRPCAAFGQGL